MRGKKHHKTKVYWEVNCWYLLSRSPAALAVSVHDGHR